jgi:hypothetical protein
MKINSNSNYEKFKEIYYVLKEMKIISDLEIYKNENLNNLGSIVNSSKLIIFPDVFSSSKDDILMFLDKILYESNDEYSKRIIINSAFEDKIYDIEKFITETKDIIRIANDLDSTITNSEKFAVPILAVRAKKGALNHPTDQTLRLMSNVLSKMSESGKLFISKGEFSEIYSTFATKNSKAKE